MHEKSGGYLRCRDFEVETLTGGAEASFVSLQMLREFQLLSWCDGRHLDVGGHKMALERALREPALTVDKGRRQADILHCRRLTCTACALLSNMDPQKTTTNSSGILRKLHIDISYSMASIFSLL